MKEHTVNGRTVEYFEAIDDLPIVRHHRFNEFISLSSGIGSTMSDVDNHIMGIVQMVQKGDKEMAVNKLLNMRQGIQFAIENVDPKSMAFASLVWKIDGKVCDDLTDNGLKKVINLLSEIKVTYGMVKAIVEYVKKKLKRKSKSTFLN
jgi:hypothetical protein